MQRLISLLFDVVGSEIDNDFHFLKEARDLHRRVTMIREAKLIENVQISGKVMPRRLDLLF